MRPALTLVYDFQDCRIQLLALAFRQGEALEFSNGVSKSKLMDVVCSARTIKCLSAGILLRDVSVVSPRRACARVTVVVVCVCVCVCVCIRLFPL